MSVPYNPFELLNLPLLKDLLRQNNHFLVVQRLCWPGVAVGKGFIATPYPQEKPARLHAQKLAANEGRLIVLKSETNKILNLIESPKYLLFLNIYRDPDGEDRVLKYYQTNILSNLKMLSKIQVLEQVSIKLSFNAGKPTAMIQSDETVQEFNLYDLIK